MAGKRGTVSARSYAGTGLAGAVVAALSEHLADGGRRPCPSLQSAILDSSPKTPPWVDGNDSVSDLSAHLVTNYVQQLLKMQLNKTGSISAPVKSEGTSGLPDEHLHPIVLTKQQAFLMNIYY